MSHVVTVDIELTDLESIKRAAEACGCTLQKAETYKWYGTHVGDYPIPEGFTKDELGRCDHKIVPPKKDGVEPYEAGLVFRDGQYHMLMDFWGQGGSLLEEAIGKRGERFAAEYGLASAQRAAERLGWMTERTPEGIKVYHPSGGHITVSKAADVEAHGFMGNGCQDATNALAAAMGSTSAQFVKPEANLQQQQNFAKE